MAMRGWRTPSWSVSLRFFSPPDRSTFSGPLEEALVEADALGLGQHRDRTSPTADTRPAPDERLGEHGLEGHARDLRRVLHGEEEPGRRPLVGRHGRTSAPSRVMVPPSTS
jgi:hypothetical protein